LIRSIASSNCILRQPEIRKVTSEPNMVHGFVDYSRMHTYIVKSTYVSSTVAGEDRVYGVLKVDLGDGKPNDMRLAFKGIRGLLQKPSAFEGGNQITMQIPLHGKHKPDADNIELLRIIQQYVWAEVYADENTRKLWKHIYDKVAEDCKREGITDELEIATREMLSIQGSPFVRDDSTGTDDDLKSIRLKWIVFEHGHRPGKLWNMTKRKPSNYKAKEGVPEPSFFPKESKPLIDPGDIDRGCGVDGSFKVDGWYAQQGGQWGISASIVSMRVFPGESYDNCHAGCLPEKLQDVEKTAGGYIDYDF